MRKVSVLLSFALLAVASCADEPVAVKTPDVRIVEAMLRVKEFLKYPDSATFTELGVCRGSDMVMGEVSANDENDVRSAPIGFFVQENIPTFDRTAVGVQILLPRVADTSRQMNEPLSSYEGYRDMCSKLTEAASTETAGSAASGGN